MRPYRQIGGRRALIFAAAFSITLLSSLGWAAEKTSPPTVSDIRLTKTYGEVTITEGKQDPITAVKGMPLEVGDILRTGASSSAEISFHGGRSLITLRANTSFKIESLGEEKNLFELMMGTLFARVHKKYAKTAPITIRTPTATASIKGTEFGIVVVAGDNGIETLIGVFDEGKIRVTGSSGKDSEILISNQETQIIAGRRPAIPFQLSRLKKHRRFVRGLRAKTRVHRKGWKPLIGADRSKLRGRLFKKARTRLKDKVKRGVKNKVKPSIDPSKAVIKNKKSMEDRRRRIRRRRRKNN